MFGGGVGGEGHVKGFSMQRIFHGGREFPLDIQTLFKKPSEINKKLTESKEQHLDLEQTEIITYMRGFTPSSIPHFLR